MFIKMLQLFFLSSFIVRPSLSYYTRNSVSRYATIYMRSKKTVSKKMKINNSRKMFIDESFDNSLTPSTENQVSYYNALKNNKKTIIIANGPAGTGKTHFACEEAINMLSNDEINRVVITRPIVSVDNEEMGFLPGTINRKMAPWTRPIFDIFLEYYDQRQIDRMVTDGIIEIAPIAYMRGRTFKRCFVIADEMQNSTPIQMKMLLTRLGQESRIVLTGDLKQTDLKDQENGFQDFLSRYNTRVLRKGPLKNMDLINFTNKDVMRSDVVKSIIEIYDESKCDRDVEKAIENTVKIPKTTVAVKTLTENAENNIVSYEPSKSMDSALFPKGYNSKRYDEKTGNWEWDGNKDHE